MRALKILLGGFTLIVVVSILVPDTRTAEEKAVAGFDFNVKFTCENAVKSRLKTPATADFPAYSQWKRIGKSSEDEVVVWSHVDAQNSFGALIRQNFSCHFRKDNQQLALVKVNI